LFSRKNRKETQKLDRKWERSRDKDRKYKKGRERDKLERGQIK
jgi:hypothetical protein